MLKKIIVLLGVWQARMYIYQTNWFTELSHNRVSLKARRNCKCIVNSISQKLIEESNFIENFIGLLKPPCSVRTTHYYFYMVMSSLSY